MQARFIAIHQVFAKKSLTLFSTCWQFCHFQVQNLHLLPPSADYVWNIPEELCVTEETGRKSVYARIGRYLRYALMKLLIWVPYVYIICPQLDISIAEGRAVCYLTDKQSALTRCEINVFKYHIPCTDGKISVTIKIKITFNFGLNHCFNQLVVFVHAELSSLLWHRRQVLLVVEVSSVARPGQFTVWV